MIDIKQHIDVTLLRFEDDATPILIDTHRTQIVIPGAIDLLVVGAGIRWVSLEFNRPLQNLSLDGG